MYTVRYVDLVRGSVYLLICIYRYIHIFIDISRRWWSPARAPAWSWGVPCGRSSLVPSPSRRRTELPIVNTLQSSSARINTWELWCQDQTLESSSARVKHLRALAPGANTWELYRQDQSLESSSAKIKHLRALAPGADTWELYCQDQTLESFTARSKHLRALAPGADTWELYHQDQTLESSSARSGVCSTDLRLYTSTNALKQVYTSPEAIYLKTYFLKKCALNIIYNF